MDPVTHPRTARPHSGRDTCQRPRLLAATLMAMAVLTDAAVAATYRVGVGGGCTHADLSSALAAAATNPGPDEVRLLTGSSHQGPFLAFTDGLTLIGGFASCGATTATGVSTLLGDNASRALYISASGASTLERLQLTGGTVTNSGGGLWIQGSAAVTVRDVSIFGNSATARGGNVYVNAFTGLSVNFAGSSLIAAGAAQDGGGLACSGDGSITFGNAVAVANNNASRDGGGIHLSAGCVLETHAGGSAGGGILSNTASGNGGGVFVESGADFYSGYATDGPARIEGNDAGAVGGGIFATGVGSRVYASFTHLSGNHAGSAGGGLAADHSATVDFDRSAAVSPCNFLRCARIDNNGAPVGGAISADGFATVTINGTFLEANTASVAHPVAYLTGGADLYLYSSVIALNDGTHPFWVDGTGTNLWLGNATVAGNVDIGSGLILAGAGNAFVRVLSSAFDQTGALVAPGFSPSFGVQVDCVLSHYPSILAGLPPSTAPRLTQVIDPGLRDLAGGDYRLREDSPAIDACDTSTWSTGLLDLEGQPRDHDSLDHPNPVLPGFRDAGADEFQGLFSDDFETGRLELWAAQQV